jgi:hypothetical protein
MINIKNKMRTLKPKQVAKTILTPQQKFGIEKK